ncbi:hypothetical protein F385_841 [Pantoea agglomerans 299R]|nr:hypothetical protein F385_1943 [Pantoea agglomerans 299R]ELP25957.1 hypothetical protein F385_841 [Pantoea agglomerans 299R]
MLSMLIRTLIASLMLMCLNGCGNSGSGRVIDTGCEWASPIYVSDHDIDVMSGQTQRAILAHNETWKLNCDHHTKKK